MPVYAAQQLGGAASEAGRPPVSPNAGELSADREPDADQYETDDKQP
jgi:hypothetical protein